MKDRVTTARHLAGLLCFSVSVLCASGAAVAQEGKPTAKLEPTRTTGTAPLAVQFDATGTELQGVDAFRELTYEFDFGDDRGLTWEHSGAPRNSQKGGPIAAHVFDNPGSYTVRLSVKAPNGATSEATTTIEVQDPAATFPGEKTMCVSAAGAYDGCPEGALRERELPRTYANKRVLLNRGEQFPGIGINRNIGGVIVGAYGKGAKPIVQSVFINTGRLNDKSANDITVMDLDISDGIQHSGSGSRYLIYRNTLTRPDGNNSIEFAGALGYLAEHNPKVPFQTPREIFVVDNVVTGKVNDRRKPFLNLSGLAAYFVIMGNDMSRAQEHTVRIFAMHKGFIAHNALRGLAQSGSGPSIRHVLKLHSGGLLPYADDWRVTNGKWASSQIVIADNLLGDPENNGSFTVSISSENRDPETVQGIEDVIVERNKFVRGPYTNTEVEFVARRFTTRGNIRADGGVPNLSIGQPSPSLPEDWNGPYYVD